MTEHDSTVPRRSADVSGEPVAAIGYVSAITLVALQNHAEGHGFVVASAGYDTTIPLYAAPPAPSASAIEHVILRRLRENRIEGYTLEMSKEIAALAQPSSPAVSQIECPNCHNANSCGDYEGPTCDVCHGEGFVGPLSQPERIDEIELTEFLRSKYVVGADLEAHHILSKFDVRRK